MRFLKCEFSFTYQYFWRTALPDPVGCNSRQSRLVREKDQIEGLQVNVRVGIVVRGGEYPGRQVYPVHDPGEVEGAQLVIIRYLFKH